MGHRGRVRQTLILALMVGLALGPAPSWSCLQCDPSFAMQFASYIPQLSRKSWGIGDVPAAGRRLRGWAQDTLDEIRLDVPLEIPLEELQKVAVKTYSKLNAVFKGKTYKPGVLPETLRSIFQEQVSMLRDAIIESRVKCERHCGINWYDAISCETCNLTKPSCFGYNCESSNEWENALKDLYAYINNLQTTPAKLAVALKEIPIFSNCTAISLENLNFDSINATLSQNWLTAKAKNESGGETPAAEAPAAESRAPSCPINTVV